MNEHDWGRCPQCHNSGEVEYGSGRHYMSGGEDCEDIHVRTCTCTAIEPELWLPNEYPEDRL